MEQLYHTPKLTPGDVLDAIEDNRSAIQDSEDVGGVSEEDFSQHYRDNFRTVAWEFTRKMFNHPAMFDLKHKDSHLAVARVEPILERLHRAGHLRYSGEHDDPWKAALGTEGTKEHYFDPYEDFVNCWTNPKLKRSLFDVAFYRAQSDEQYRDPERFGPQFADPRREKARLLLAWCRELARPDHMNKFYLAQRQAARYLDTHQPTVSGWLRQAVSLEIITVMSEGSRTLANEYEWSYDLFSPGHPDFTRDALQYAEEP